MQIKPRSLVVEEERPLELLFACHQKIRHFSMLSGQVAAHVSMRGVDEEARLAACNILRYFELALPHHHADEEEDVFPALLQLHDPLINHAIDGLQKAHRELDLMWTEIRPWLNQIANSKAPATTPLVLSRFINTYLAHADQEERDVFPAIARLPEGVVEQLAQRMRQRRGSST
ncbi:MAG TPA: hemerythrin domain-containing protein [Rhodocyclaceae bacterium]|nr:hemerythrin domain-containing protein [Rhodocyclaceae bacterium]